MDIITRLEEAILIAIWRLKENAYGVTIHEEVVTSVRKKYSMGALYFSLDQLLRKGYVEKKLVNVYNKKGGRSRTYYSMTDNGKNALESARNYQESLWEGISDLNSEISKS